MEATARAEPACQHNSYRAESDLVQFTLQTDVEPSVLPRILQPFALRNLTPHRVSCRQQDGRMQIALVIQGLGERETQHLSQRLAQLIPVHGVVVSFETPSA